MKLTFFVRQQVQLDNLKIPADNGVVIKVNGAGLLFSANILVLIAFALSFLYAV